MGDYYPVVFKVAANLVAPLVHLQAGLALLILEYL